MISSVSLFEIMSAVIPDPKFFFWTAAFAADAAVGNPNSIKMLLINCVSTFFINGKPAGIIGLRKLRNPTFWLKLFLVINFNKVSLFSKVLIIFVISFVSLFAKVIPKPVSLSLFFYQ